ncbi:MAG TPA: glycosyltransferase family 39 protein [Candidatus Didemnitutus sp.]|nr:glycosyltransferase family 39 protein [Candidatus Didemnitutus sp.]
MSLAVAGALLLVFWIQAVTASRHWSQTSDELPHLMAGYAYDKIGDFRLQPENGVLPQRLHGLVPMALGARMPDNKVWWENSQVWQLGWDLLYGLDNPTDRMVQSARALNALFGIGLGAFIFFVARKWYGIWPAAVALGLFAFSPNFLFHSAQATSDAAGTLFLTLSAWCFWSFLQRRTAVSLLLAGLVAGLALTAKFNGVLVLPIFAILVVGDVLLAPAGEKRLRRFGLNVGGAFATAFVAWIVIWACFDFRFAARAPDAPALVQFSWPWRPSLMLAGWKGAVIAHALDWHLFPEAFLRGLDYVFASESERPSFLAATYSSTGSWEFFPVVFLIKTPLAILAGGLLALASPMTGFGALETNRRREVVIRWLPLVAVAGVTWAVALTSHLNIGHRHILAVYPPLFIAIGGLATARGAVRFAVPILCVVQIAESIAIRPNYAAYFNVIGGGPSRAYRLVVDSSLDWGQDLPALQEWITRNRRANEPFYFSYFGNAWPPHYGVRPTIFLPAVNVVRPPFKPYDLEPGLYAISATSLSEVYSGTKGPWTPGMQALYDSLPHDSEAFADVRFSRLCKYLQHRRPDAAPGYSILVFRLSAAEIQQALHGPVFGWDGPEVIP